MSVNQVTALLAEFCAGLSPVGIPDRVKARTRLLLVDLFGSIVRARSEAVATPLMLAVGPASPHRPQNLTEILAP
jgi:hypothetical protein